MDYANLCSLSNEQLSHRDIAEISLDSAVELPGSEIVDIPACLRVLESWTALVQRGINNALRDRSKFPMCDDLSEAEYRILTMFSVLYRHVGLTLNTECLDPDNIYDGSNSSLHFIHGVLLTGDPATCCTAPVIFTAIGRRLGYPIRLVKTRAHLFCRWVGSDGERFNIEATNQGYYRTPDQHYHTWPLPIYPRALQGGLFLTDLTPRQELALFLHLRGICLLWNLRPSDAVNALYHACQLDPLDYFFHNEWIIASMFEHAKQDAANRYGIHDPDPRLWQIPEWCKESNAQLYQAACNRLTGILTQKMNKKPEPSTARMID
ncbi:hypothetical protein SH668x_000099 [Planctomicrobium sp. SH668]|uniref:hypothetical protein n=1 Tax=Planctomicrobium sp. SH668 TaxID=3448126 RepID=UPI003F5C8082